MKGNELLDKMDLIEDAYIEEAASQAEASGKDRRRLSRILVPAGIALAAAAALFFAGRLLYHRIAPERSPYETRHESEPAPAPGETEIAYEKPWEQRENWERFMEFELDGKRYQAACTPVGADEIGDAVGTVQLSTMDLQGQPHEIGAQVCTMKSFLPDAALALRYEGEEDFYAFLNPWYEPATLGEFMEALQLRNKLTVTGKAHYTFFEERGPHNIEFEGITKDFVLEKVLAPYAATAWKPYHDVPASLISFGVGIPELGSSNVTLSLSGDGYLWTNLLHTAHAFYIGEEAVQSILEEVHSNFKGYEIIYDFQEDQPGEPEAMSPGYDPGFDPDAPVSNDDMPENTLSPDDIIEYTTEGYTE